MAATRIGFVQAHSEKKIRSAIRRRNKKNSHPLRRLELCWHSDNAAGSSTQSRTLVA